ncbi:MAG TPA: alpha-L-fucosidase [Paludibacteraceae bacterium]|nr:alpha-L-fucosidase [Paludibacteraceae bacterium]HON01618.1 alpha-L-fucosidase [Paludibacteraceae bacterium]HPD59661.1 alpha-L-fucosidase [Paludibacteraceae bacterium]HPQ11883.1 alpha-L-fucosidase [Paludibacteraceae bacterium]HRS23274.1 alpha-L-fucosidase [Paludibacteraceae bacterium]
MRFLFITLLFSNFVLSSICQQNHTLHPDKRWFKDAKYGVFVHWTLNVSHKDRERMPYEEFQIKCFDEAKKFTANNYDPKLWAKMFKSWGAKYVVLTTKHHLGFALYDSEYNQFTALKSTPANRDLVREFCDAMRYEGIKVGLYFSLPDKFNYDYPTLVTQNNGKEVIWQQSDFVAWKRFTDNMLNEIKHLCTNYGRIDLFWFDGDWERNADMWRSKEIVDTINKYQPWAVLNNRLRSANIGDFSTPEMVIPIDKRNGMWELCTTLGYNWDGPESQKSIKKPSETVRILGDVITQGGNLLLNISPDYSGSISQPQIKSMELLGKWITEHAEAIYDTEQGLPLGLFNGGSTRRGSTIYLIAYETAPELVLKNIEGEIESIVHLKSGKHLTWRNMDDYHSDNNRKGWRFISLPTNLIEPYATVLKITFKDKKVKVKKHDGTYLEWKE